MAGRPPTPATIVIFENTPQRIALPFRIEGGNLKASVRFVSGMNDTVDMHFPKMDNYSIGWHKQQILHNLAHEKNPVKAPLQTVICGNGNIQEGDRIVMKFTLPANPNTDPWTITLIPVLQE